MTGDRALHRQRLRRWILVALAASVVAAGAWTPADALGAGGADGLYARFHAGPYEVEIVSGSRVSTWSMPGQPPVPRVSGETCVRWRLDSASYWNGACGGDHPVIDPTLTSATLVVEVNRPDGTSVVATLDLVGTGAPGPSVVAGDHIGLYRKATGVATFTARSGMVPRGTIEPVSVSDAGMHWLVSDPSGVVP